MQQLIDLYKQWSGNEPASVDKMQGAGSNRQYFRLTATDGSSVVGVIGTSREEDHAFINIAKQFAEQKLPVPQVLAVSDDEMRYLQTDLGSTSLFDAIRGGREAGGRYNLAEQELLKKTIRALPGIQIRGAMGMDWSVCYPQPEFNEESVLFDLNYFKYCFLKPTELDFNEVYLEANFRRMAKDLTAEPGESFLYRDFQARNVMLDADGNPQFIDFQGGRRGPYYYDLASFLWQASARYSDKLRRELVAEYYDALQQYTEVPSLRHFVNRLSLFVLFRTLQVLGAGGAEIRDMLRCEMGIYFLAGLLLGLPGSRAIKYLLEHVLVSDSYKIDMHVTVPAYLITLLICLLMAMLTVWMEMRAVRRISLTEVLKERE